MSNQAEVWARHTIEEIGLSINVYQPWPLLSFGGEGIAGIYQPVAGTSGIVFVRYGAHETLENYSRALGGMLTDVSVVNVSAILFSGREAQRMTVWLVQRRHEVYSDDPDQGITHGTIPERRTLIVVIGFSNRDIPILVGYRLPEEIVPTYQDQLEEMMESVSTWS